MIRHTLVIGAVLAALLGATWAQTPYPQQEQAAPPSDLNAVIRALQADAQAWAQEEKVASPSISQDLRTVSATDDVVNQLQRALIQPQDNDPIVDLYIRYQLLQPLVNASPAQLQQALGVLNTLDNFAQYKEMPQLSPQQLAALKQPPPQGPTASTSPSGLTQQKLLQDRQVLQNNVLVRQIKFLINRLRLLAGQPQADQDVLKSIQDNLAKKYVAYMDGLQAIRLEVAEIPVPRAKALYEQLVKMVAAAGPNQDDFTVPTEANLSSTENSAFVTRPQVPAKDLVTTVNLLATAARQPAIRMPKPTK